MQTTTQAQQPQHAATVQQVGAFFDLYAAALLARDEAAMAELYAVPSLILFPGNAIAVSEPAQTRAFFASAWLQYDGVDDATPTISLMAEGPGSVWAEVTWRLQGRGRERFCYQLVEQDEGYRIAVLTLLG
jgi:hypothetical protein